MSTDFPRGITVFVKTITELDDYRDIAYGLDADGAAVIWVLDFSDFGPGARAGQSSMTYDCATDFPPGVTLADSATVRTYVATAEEAKRFKELVDAAHATAAPSGQLSVFALAEQISRFVEGSPGATCSDVDSATKNAVSDSAIGSREVLDLLIWKGHVRRTPGPCHELQHFSIKPYRKEDDS